jgi:hypothetical protein
MIDRQQIGAYRAKRLDEENAEIGFLGGEVRTTTKEGEP